MSKELIISNTIENFSIGNISIEVVADVMEELDRMYLNREISMDEYWEMKNNCESKLSFDDSFKVTEIIVDRCFARMAAM